MQLWPAHAELPLIETQWVSGCLFVLQLLLFPLGSVLNKSSNMNRSPSCRRPSLWRKIRSRTLATRAFTSAVNSNRQDRHLHAHNESCTPLQPICRRAKAKIKLSLAVVAVAVETPQPIMLADHKPQSQIHQFRTSWHIWGMGGVHIVSVCLEEGLETRTAN